MTEQRLIDANKLKEQSYEISEWDIGFHHRVVDESDIDDAPTVSTRRTTCILRKIPCMPSKILAVRIQTRIIMNSYSTQTSLLRSKQRGKTLNELFGKTEQLNGGEQDDQRATD